MQYAMKNHIFEVREMKGEFTVEKPNCTLYGHGDTDYLIRTMDGEWDIISKNEFESEKCVPVKPKLDIDKEAMAFGYMEMGDINTDIANEAVHTVDDGFYNGLEDLDVWKRN